MASQTQSGNSIPETVRKGISKFKNSDSVQSLAIRGDEVFDISGLDNLSPQQDITFIIRSENSGRREIQLLSRIDTSIEVDYFKHGGILPYVLRELILRM